LFVSEEARLPRQDAYNETMKYYLLVDGYNMIGAWHELRVIADRSLEDARDRLTEMLANYQGHSGKKIILVFDAHQVAGTGGRYQNSGLEVIYTKEKETADECIERLVGDLSGRRTIIQVATSDSVEQHVTFGRGGLRLSARELLLAIKEGEKQIRKTLSEPPPRKSSIDNALTEDMKRKMEKWRRGLW
jgi:predicted RNA-binding protein with PIN domain